MTKLTVRITRHGALHVRANFWADGGHAGELTLRNREWTTMRDALSLGCAQLAVKLDVQEDVAHPVADSRQLDVLATVWPVCGLRECEVCAAGESWRHAK